MSASWQRKIMMVVILGVGGLVFLFGLRSDNNSELKKDEVIPGVHFDNVELVGNNRGIRQWQLFSKSLRQENELIFLDELDHVIVYEENLPKYYVEAEHGIWNTREDQLTLSNNVIVHDQAGFWLTTNNLIWYSTDEAFEFMGDTTVRFERGGAVNE